MTKEKLFNLLDIKKEDFFFYNVIWYNKSELQRLYPPSTYVASTDSYILYTNTDTDWSTYPNK